MWRSGTILNKKIAAMRSKQRRSLIVGIFITLGLAIFIAAIYLVGTKENIFGSTIEVSAIFEDVKGLREGDRVRLSGIDIGTVGSIGFLSDNRVHIQMSLEEELVVFVKKDSRATIGNEGLMGAKVVMILPGSMLSEPVTEFDTLQTIEQIDVDDIMHEVMKSSENITVVSSELISITQKINRGMGSSERSLPIPPLLQTWMPPAIILPGSLKTLTGYRKR